MRTFLIPALAAVAACSSPAADDPHPAARLRLATAYPKGHLLAELSERIAAIATADSRGRLTFEVTPAAGDEADVNARAARGMVDLQVAGGLPVQTFAPQTFFFDAPYVIRDYSHFLRVWAGKLGDAARDQVRERGHQVALGTVYRGSRHVTANRAVAGPPDVTGLRLRLPAVPAWTAVWTALEARPVTVPLPELYGSLRSGAADASEEELAQIASHRLPEVQSHLSLTGHLVVVGWVLAHHAILDKLVAGDRRTLENAVAEATAWATERASTTETELLKGLRAAGMTIVTPDAAAIRAKAKPAVDELFRQEWPATTWEEVLGQ